MIAYIHAHISSRKCMEMRDKDSSDSCRRHDRICQCAAIPWPVAVSQGVFWLLGCSDPGGRCSTCRGDGAHRSARRDLAATRPATSTPRSTPWPRAKQRVSHPEPCCCARAAKGTASCKVKKLQDTKPSCGQCLECSDILCIGIPWQGVNYRREADSLVMEALFAVVPCSEV